MTALNTFKKIAGVATVAIAMGASALTPVQAQAFHFGFGTNNQNGPNVQFGIGTGNDHGRYHYRPGRHSCLSTGELRSEIRDQGYRDVRIDAVGRFRTDARGTRGGNTYRLVVDSCSGDVIGSDRIRRR